MSDDWWSRHLHRQAAPAARSAPSLPPAHPPQQQYPQQQYPQQQLSPMPNQKDALLAAVRQGQLQIKDIVGYWEGGEATRTQTERCPQCGGPHYFTHFRNSRMPAPAPVCMTCGYNGLFTQGDPANWQTN